MDDRSLRCNNVHVHQNESTDGSTRVRSMRLGGSRIWTVCTSGGSLSKDSMTAELAGSDEGAVSLSITSTDHAMWSKLLKVKPIFLILRCHLSRFDKMTVVNLEFPSTLSKSDPQKQPVIIIGQLKNLMKAKYSSVKAKLEPHVTEQVLKLNCDLFSLCTSGVHRVHLLAYRRWLDRTGDCGTGFKSCLRDTQIYVYSSAIIVAHQLVSLSQVYSAALASLHPSPTDSCSLYLNLATVAALPVKCSRHNTPSRAHFITKLVKSATVGVDESVVIVCRREDVFASACAVARAYPLYSRKTTNNLSASTKTATVQVHFVLLASSDDAGSMAVNNGTAEGELGLGEADVELLKNAAMAVRLAARIVDTPCNEMNVDTFVQEVLTVGQALGVKSTVIRGEELNERGFGGIYGVGKAALVPPALVVLSYLPQGATETIAWVGKGIVYDTGGLSIKGKTSMPGMKRDCGGAAGVLGAFFTTVKAGFTQNLHAVFCLAENAVGPRSTRPDDIHTLYSGRTVEINNTDAEGRLVLSDGVSYAQKDLKANIIVDMATLTGAQAICTGKYHAAVLTNNAEWEGAAVHAGKSSGDLVFPILYCPELHFSEFSSAVADMKNSVTDRSNAQSSCAGLFIGAHLGFDYPGVWVHIDMASPVYVVKCGLSSKSDHSSEARRVGGGRGVLYDRDDTTAGVVNAFLDQTKRATTLMLDPDEYNLAVQVDLGERATGYGVAILSTLFGKFSNSNMLQSLSEQTDSEWPSTKKLKRN
uniref:Cytosol aminopeptidase domain-containing protein n=1 Tax=Timema shepardi TaxID=629360 RepID=A0A7R9B4Z3_TIMSH|nr:unnamed protein product [Timema shepardi]